MSPRSTSALMAGGGMAVLVAAGFALGWYSAGKPRTPIVGADLFAVEASPTIAIQETAHRPVAPEELPAPKEEEQAPEEIAPTVVKQAPLMRVAAEPLGDRVSLPIRSRLPAEALLMQRRQQASESELR